MNCISSEFELPSVQLVQESWYRGLSNEILMGRGARKTSNKLVITRGEPVEKKEDLERKTDEGRTFTNKGPPGNAASVLTSISQDVGWRASG